ncbi:MAG: DNA mismatch repair endonuclease MutL [Lachnospiraceae bacterium]|nr:DNA mismatch repair endonuclease MutL [Lachnospiraceae bacterium]
MPGIHVLDKLTIDKIAAGEVIERPSSVVKELVENAIDAGATAITCEIANGGIDLIRVTDNGCGIAKDELQLAFLRHSTSKLESAEDLFRISSLGFRGEALSSISAVSRLEVITKRKGDITGSSYEIHGGKEISLTDIGAPDGTTFLVRDIFYNTPARRKFLKTPITEASYISSLLEHMALSRPDISFRFVVNGQTRLATSGNGRVRDLVYSIYGRETAAELEEISFEREDIRVSGFLGKPVVVKGNRSFENYFVNGRWVQNKVVMKAIEEAYRPFLMQHKFPLTVLYLDMPAEYFDVNVHPQKMEIRFRSEQTIYDTVLAAVQGGLEKKEFIPETVLAEEKAEKKETLYKPPEPFEIRRMEKAAEERKTESFPKREIDDRSPVRTEIIREKKPDYKAESGTFADGFVSRKEKPVQQSFFETKLLSEEGIKKHRLIGQAFETYWLLQMDDKLYIMDQHAAHEKVLYERKMKELAERKHPSQNVSPPVMISLTMREELLLNRYMDAFSVLGYEISAFGGREYAVSAVPYDLYGLDVRALLTEMLGEMEDEFSEKKPEMILSKLASMSCKAAVKGENLLSFEEAEALLKELLTLENPYACPHGRPTMISLSRAELDRKFKRIV